MSNETRYAGFIKGFTERVGPVIAEESPQPGRRKLDIEFVDQDRKLAVILLGHFGKVQRDNRISAQPLAKAASVEFNYGCQVNYRMPVEAFRIDYFRQAFQELARHMETGQRGIAELVETEEILGMRIARALSLRFRDTESAFRKAGANLGTQAHRDCRKLLEYAALPV